MNKTMKTPVKRVIRPTDELWQWAALKRTSYVASKYPATRSSRSTMPRPLSQLSRSSAQMAQGILARLYTILRDSCRTRR